MSALFPALKRCAAELAASGKEAESIEKVLKGADVMEKSGSVYLSWARHYAALSEGDFEAPDEAEFGL